MIVSVDEHRLYMQHCLLYSKFSKCTFTHVAALAVNERGRIIATGVNGTIPNAPNCCDQTFECREDHVPFTQRYEIHAELNLILEMVKNKVSFESLTIYVTHSPCHECMKALLGLGSTINKIIFNEKYHRTSDVELRDMIQFCADRGTTLISLEDLCQSN